MDDDVLDESDLVDQNEFDHLTGILADGVIGAISGLTGMALMTVVLLVAESMGVFSPELFAEIAELTGADHFLPAITAGYGIYLFHGMVTWPLLFAALVEYLPAQYNPVCGVIYGTVLWSGFVFAFYDGYVGNALVMFLGMTLLAHWAYGFGLGVAFEYFTTRPDTLV